MKTTIESNGARLHCYASGSGALGFTWTIDNKATSKPVTTNDVKRYVSLSDNRHLLDRFRIACVGGIVRLIPIVKRLLCNRLEYDGKVWAYTGDASVLAVYNMHGDRVRNLSILTALRFFLRNEGTLYA